MAGDGWIVVTDTSDDASSGASNERSLGGYQYSSFSALTAEKGSTAELSDKPRSIENQKPTKSEYLHVHATYLYCTPERMITNGTLIYRPGMPIEWVGPQDQAPSEYDGRVVAKVPYLMAGLWDVHVHLTGCDTLPLDDLLFLNPYLAGARLSRDLAALLNAGYTSVRELGGHGWAVRQAVAEGWIPGPNIYSSVSLLSITGGHGDAHRYPLGVVSEAQQANNFYEVCDGVDACIKAVRRKLRQGADVIKVAASGGVLSLVDDPDHQQFGPAELKAIVDEAARAGRIVSAHCHGRAGIVAALDAGVKVIEHGTGLDDETIRTMKRKDVMLVAVRSIVQFGIENPGLVPPEIYRKMQAVAEQHKRAYAKAVEAGVKCALGTDLGVSSENVKHNLGMDSREIGFALEAGMTPGKVLEALTVNGPDTLGPERRPKSGVLRSGYDADFIAVKENPRRDPRVLMDQTNISHVWKAGRLYKAPGHPVGFFPVAIEEGRAR